MSNHPLILTLDVSGAPHRWITYEGAAYYIAKGQVAWSLGQDEQFTIHGGKSRMTGERSYMDIDPILAIKGVANSRVHTVIPPLTNKALFRRDQNLCAYCGNDFAPAKLTRDHIQPRSKGGPDKWTNVVTACGHCNRHKSDNTLEQANMKLLYVPYAPNRSEWLILQNRRILVDQMDYLLKMVPKTSRLHA